MFLLWEFWDKFAPKLSLWLFGLDEGRICCLSCLSYIYVGSLARLLRPLCPRHLRICLGTQIAQFCGKQNVFFQDLWANQCCCTDRFSPISTLPSDENIVDWAEALWDLPHQAALRKRRTWPNGVSVAAPSGPCPKNGGRILACGPNSLCSCVAWRMSSFLIFQNPFDEPSSRLCRLPAGCE